jgi:hypothetical protein
MISKNSQTSKGCPLKTLILPFGDDHTFAHFDVVRRFSRRPQATRAHPVTVISAQLQLMPLNWVIDTVIRVQ